MQMEMSEILKGFPELPADVYTEHITHGGKHTSDLQEVADKLLWGEDYNKFTIEVQKDSDDYHISFKVISREK
jgi:hypothetical protein